MDRQVWSLTRVYDETQYKLRGLNAAGVRDFERFSLISATCTSHLTFAAVTNCERGTRYNRARINVNCQYPRYSLSIDLNPRESRLTAVSDGIYEYTEYIKYIIKSIFSCKSCSNFSLKY